MFAQGSLAGKLTPGQTVPAINDTGWLLFDMKAPDGGNEDEPGQGLWSNFHDLAGQEDANVLFIRSTDNAKGLWRALQIDVVAMDLAKDLKLETTGQDADWVQNMYQTTYGYTDEINTTDWTNEIDTDPC